MKETWNDLAGNGAVRIATVGVLAILALFLLVQTIDAAGNLGRSDTPATNTITVNGTGKATAVPDTAHVTFSVIQEASTAAAAQEAATVQANAALDFITSQDIEKKDVKTESYTITPKYSTQSPCPPGGMCPAGRGTPTIVGYTVSESVQVTVRDLDKVSDILAGLGKLNVQNLYGPDFSLDDPEELQNAARARAIADAKEQAQVLAKQLGVHLVRIVNYGDQSGGYYPMAYGKGGVAMEAMASDAAPRPQVPVGENEYTANVYITYEIR